MNRKILLLVLACIFFSSNTFAQKIEQNGWLFWSHEQKISGKWQLLSDIQIRSADNLEYLEVLLIRPGIGYKITDKQTATIGYTYFAAWEKENGIKTYEPENRIFEQYEVEHGIGKAELSHRLRLEQRFLNPPDGNKFAQRLRYYLQAKFPFKTDSTFKKGFYTALQNEIFLNVQNKEEVNQSFYDQNRTYLGLGFKFNDQYELEAGYMFRYQIEEEINLRNNVLQISLKTSL